MLLAEEAPTHRALAAGEGQSEGLGSSLVAERGRQLLPEPDCGTCGKNA